MKILALFLLFFIELSSIAQQNNVTITGKINSVTDRTVQLIIKDLIKERIIKTTKVDKNGAFIFRFNQKYPHDNYIKYGNELSTIFIRPNDSLHIEITGNKTSFSGDNKIINNEIDFFLNNIWGFKYYGEMNKATETLNPSEFKFEMKRIKKKFGDLLNNFNINNNTSPEFRQWANYYLKFAVLEDLMRYSWINPDDKNRKLPDDYFDFIKDSEVINSNETHEVKFVNQKFDVNALICSRTNSFIDEYFMLLASTTKPKKPSDNEIKKNFGRFIDVIMNQSDGQTREILLTKLFYMLVDFKALDVFETYLPIFNQYVKNESLREIVTSKSGKLSEILEIHSIPESATLVNLAKETILMNLIEKIISNNKNKVIYIDVWSTWCGPCLGMMPYSKKLQNTFKDEQVSFVYLCAKSKEENWKSTIADLELNGQHYFIDADQYNLLAEKIQIIGVPHYILINKEGIIVDENALSPSEKPLNDRIRSLLN